MISNIATDPTTGRQVIVANFESFRKQLEDNIDKACNEFLNEPDWNKNFEIYDALNRTAYLCPFAVAAIRRKLKTKNPEIEVLALHLLEGMIKNVPSSHGAVAQPSFMRYLIKVGMDTRKEGMMKSIGKKFKKDSSVNNAHLRAQAIDKALLIIQMLKNAYENSNTYPIFVDTYRQLLKQGVRFPALTKDEDATVFAPLHSNRFANYGKNKPPSAMGSLSQSGSVVTNHVNIDRSLPMIRPVQLLGELLHPDLKTAQENAKFFFEMINASEPGANLLDNELIQQLYTSTTEWQQRVQQILQDPSCNDIVMQQGFQVNDVINNVLTDYNGLLTGTHRRYEEPLGDIEELNDKTKDSSKNASNDASDDAADKTSSDAKKDDEDEAPKDFGIAPPPADEGSSSHARNLSRQRSRKARSSQSMGNSGNQAKHGKQDSADLLDLFTPDTNNNNNNKKQPPHMNSQPSSMGLFDLIAIPSGPSPLGTVPETQPQSQQGTMASAASGGSSAALDSLGDPFAGKPAAGSGGGAALPAASQTKGGAANPFDMLGGSNNNNSNNAAAASGSGGNLFGNDPFAGLSSNTNASANTNVNANAAANPKPANDFMGGGDNPFDMFGGGGNSNAANANNANNANNGNKPANDFMGGGANPFAGL